MKRRLSPLSILGLLLAAPAITQAAPPPQLTAPEVLPYWESFGTADGLPSDKIMAVAADREKLWVATDHGVALIVDRQVTATYTQADGLGHDVVLSLAVDPASRDVWFGTAGGLTRLSGGQFTTYTQMNSGLPNDVIFGVTVENQNPWVATTAGTGRYRLRDQRWDIYTPANSPQHEPWGYFVDYADGKVWAALWGGGALEFDVETMIWKSYLDPDREMEIDLFRDDGILHVITTGISYRSKIMWVSTYFGLSRYDGNYWHSLMEKDSGLASDFINFVRSDGEVAWIATDKGLSAIRSDGREDWVVTYTPIHGPMEGARGWEARTYHNGKLVKKKPLAAGLSNNFLWGVEPLGGEVWVASSAGLSHGSTRPFPPRPPRLTPAAPASNEHGKTPGTTLGKLEEGHR